MLADLLVPVPRAAANVGDLLNWSEDALSVVQVVTLVAAEAGTSVVKGVALIGNRDADLVSVEDPVVGALLADLPVPVPSGTSNVGD